LNASKTNFIDYFMRSTYCIWIFRYLLAHL